MLGVLAIIGILSVIGMMGYTSAMDKNRANTLIQEAQKRAVIVAGQIGFNNQTPSLAEFSAYNTTSAGTFGDVITKGLSGQFGIQVSNVSKSICQNILNTIGDKTPIRRLSYEATPTTPITTCEEEDNFLFVYNNDMTGDDKVEPPKSCRTVNDCKTSCATCEIPEDEDVGICTNECEEPTKLCTVDTDCNEKNECMVCDTDVGMCKDGCERVQFLQGNGSQYIDTKVIPTKTTEFELAAYYDNVVGYPTGECIFGMRYSIGSQWRYMVSNYKSGSFGYASFGNNRRTQSTESNTHNYVFSYKNGVFSNGHNINKSINISNDSSPVNPIPSSWSLFLFAGNYPAESFRDGTQGKVYYLKLWENGKLVRDFVPVISPNGEACMFNKVLDEEDGKLKLYCNSGSGAFKTNKDE